MSHEVGQVRIEVKSNYGSTLSNNQVRVHILTADEVEAL
jgi:hypothetical protein